MSRAGLAAAVAILATAAPANAAPWRSTLYPTSWTPGFADASGRFLHDFSYAGYHHGERGLPITVAGPVIDVTKPPYNADASGATDATPAIQNAIDAAGAAGGGVVFLPAGTYRIAPSAPDKPSALRIAQSGVVLRGAGPDKTFLYGFETNMRHRRVVLAQNANGDPSWYAENTAARALTADVILPTKVLPVANVDGLAVGDHVVVRSDPTPALIAELGMTNTWTAANFGGPIFPRRIVAVDSTKKTITVDTPTRFRLLLRDNARVAKIPPPLREIGIESLSIGNRENTTPGTGDDDYATPGKGAYEMHEAFAIWFAHVEDGWIRNVRSYRPPTNPRDVHLLSSGIRLDFSRNVTIRDVALAKPQYKGEGGNGYLFVLTGNDCLVVDSEGRNGRHNASFAFMQSSGNVLLRFRAVDGRLPSDFHQKLSPANLVDTSVVDGDAFEAQERECCDHGHGTTESVFWNTRGERYKPNQLFQKFIVDSAQVGQGYVIGTRGPASLVRVANDLVEGVGAGDELSPPSLYEDQRARRLGLSLDDGGVSDGGVGPDASPERDAGPSSSSSSSTSGGSEGRDGPRPTPDSGCAVAASPSKGPPLSAIACAITVLAAILRRRRPEI